MGCLFASMSHPARAKRGHERPLHCLETRGVSILKTLMDHAAWSSMWKTDCVLAVCCRITGTSGLEYIFARSCRVPNHAELYTHIKTRRRFPAFLLGMIQRARSHGPTS